ncbi:hypothetical protein [Nocardioides alcanivorans]|uniref:hypothetical protein n=1 Tax=Nocardioides alcanivorans TaxID=2897352 RepID=UPI001F436446|nr:hypothetical protein [Nocardioides alcanivorans]
MTTKHVPSPTAEKPPEPRTIWGRLTVDPLAVPLSRQLVKLDWVTANRITGLAFVLALGQPPASPRASCAGAGRSSWPASSATVWTAWSPDPGAPPPHAGRHSTSPST